MKKILFIIQSYPPIRSANAVCDSSLIEELVNSGNYSVHCLVYKNYQLPKEEKIDKVHVYRFCRGIRWALFCYAKNNAQSLLGKILLKIDRVLLRINQIFTIPFYPISEPIRTLMCFINANKLYKRNRYDLIISEHNGNDTLMAGYLLKKLYKDNFIYIPIFWDALSGGFGAKYLPKRFVDYRKIKLEKRIFEISDRIIVMNSHKNHINNLWSNYNFFPKISFLDIPFFNPNRKSEFENNELFFNNNEINIVFAGNMGMRDPTYIIKLANAIVDKPIKFHFYTSINYHNKFSLNGTNLPKNVCLHDFVSHEELIKIYNEADAFLNIGVNNPNAISGKIFEYFSYGKPVISTYYIDNEACLPYIGKYPKGLAIDEKNSDILLQANKIVDFIYNCADISLDMESLKKIFKNNMPSAYIELIDRIEI